MMDIFDLCEQVDAALLDDLHAHPYLHRMFIFFDSVPGRPLTPREFYEFVGSWSGAETEYYMLFADF
ncbi:hypothetical protein SEA_SCAP1_47 [Streptomyces phage Scap1]|uniref:Uncharacterized protein n=1 Tax=Streptomyces phage Scap1 TaxID=2041354 RepID=A0A2D1GNR6_9CAUD|nr:hypothetical protein FDI71_gp47 [Streptomyces phage Scap1]ATN93696.1 hypothetical protein SEA_SCAP1_47 [Streptomyces phage Scap1]